MAIATAMVSRKLIVTEYSYTQLIRRKKIRWAASVYERGISELRGVAEQIIRSSGIEENTVFKWATETKERIQELEVLEGATVDGVYTGGSRLDGQTTAATIMEATFLGRYATVMDAEMLAIAMGWRLGNTVCTDSEAAIGRIRNLQLEPPRGWIEEQVVAAARGGLKKIAWVKRHSKVMGNELAGLKAKSEAWMVVRRREMNIATAGGIRHEFRITRRTKQVYEWDREALKGHSYIYTDRGPFAAWLNKIGRAASPMCPCRVAPQNAAHIMTCDLVQGGERRSGEDREFCRSVYRFLQENVQGV